MSGAGKATEIASAEGTASISIRGLGINELDYLLDWRMVVLDAVFGEDKPWSVSQDELRSANRNYYEQSLGKNHIACMASVDGEDVGCGAICLQDEMPSPDNLSGKCAYVMNIYTRPSFRERGVADAVMEWLIEEAQHRGVGKIYLEATCEATHLYKEIGFVPMDGMMKYASKG